jgi:vancomycin aglycone glucosyltransferase
MAAVIHHGGAGTTTQAARAGVPQIVIPHILDQFYWASRVSALRLGPDPLRLHALTPDALTARLRDALAFREGAAAFGAGAVWRHGTGEAVEAIEAIAGCEGYFSLGSSR